MPRPDLQEILNQMTATRASHQIVLYDNEQFDYPMYKIYEEIKENVDKILCFGPINSAIAAALKNAMYGGDPRWFRNQPHYNAMQRKAMCAILSENKIYDNAARKERSYSRKFTIDEAEIVSNSITSGFGTCEAFALVGAVLLRQKYKVDVSIMNIHSSLIHTFLVVNTEPAYIFDYWADIMVRYGNWSEWNECHDSCYHYNETAQIRPYNKGLAPVPKETLSRLEAIMNNPELLQARQKHIEDVSAEFESSATRPNTIP